MHLILSEFTKKCARIASNIDQFEKKEMTKMKLLGENILYEWYDWLINLPKFLEKSISDVKKRKKYETF